MSQFDNVSVLTQANVYFDGKCVSHTVILGDGSRKTLGVLLPSTLTFSTGAPETMEITGGACRVRLDGQSEWTSYSAGQSFSVPADSRFDIEALDVVNYICHFG
ncbi:pyrimidine/purine nucleoside phosphorylase [Methylotetracoccus oryzae]|uniref:pyrimidine/purine nucleoside phosphorylase n=1 Tax=Methylotetracoccus oryzae TaxID=1919059 RepID=UPI001119B311|nr:pyrimidine/purine nucleoside phosphorylase [Methylotetracoccus oryzae]